MTDFTTTPDRDPNPPDPPAYCVGDDCDDCAFHFWQCGGEVAPTVEVSDTKEPLALLGRWVTEQATHRHCRHCGGWDGRHARSCLVSESVEMLTRWAE